MIGLVVLFCAIAVISLLFNYVLLSKIERMQGKGKKREDEK